MRDTSDMMEDALSEDTMMDCGGDSGGLVDLVDLATDVADSSPTIRDAAERLLTLLGVDDGNDDFLSSSEDEGVELDVDELEDDDEDQDNTRLLHQLAASLAQELKYSQQQKPTTTRLLQSRNPFDPRDHDVQSMETMEDTGYLGHDCLQRQEDLETIDAYHEDDFHPQNETKFFGSFCQNRLDPPPCSFASKNVSSNENNGFGRLDRRLRMMDQVEDGRGERSSSQEEELTISWGAGWDACATEALRYLVEDEGLPAHHPTVLAMKNHLEVQRERVFAQYTV